MVDEALIDSITTRFHQGEKAEEIREALLNEGWSAGDIDAAFAHIRHTALMQIPMYAKVHHWMENADQKTAQLPTATLVKIFIAIGLVFIGGVVALYFFLDPLGLQTSQRDRQREDAAISIREALERYNKDERLYPAKLSQLVPKYLPEEPKDPRSKQVYSYKPLSNYTHYEFCIEFEMQTIRCVNSDPTSSIPTQDQTSAGSQMLIPTTAPQPVQYTVNGQVFIDTNKNETLDDAEEIQPGVGIKITDKSSKAVCDTETDTSGIFECTMPGEGEYMVTIAVPKGYTSSLGNPVPVTFPNHTSPHPNIETLFVGLVK